MKLKKDLVWYVGYGSNISSERFHYYIHGGQPNGSTRNYEGCRDKSKPRFELPTILNHELYFSKNSSAWTGGVAFVKTHPDDTQSTYAKMYLITKQQFEDVAKQETNSDNLQSIDFDNAIESGNTIFKTPSWYGNVLHLGSKDKLPIFTLTNEINLEQNTQPSAEYLKTIISGIKESHNLTSKEIFNYIANKRGIHGSYEESKLLEIINTQTAESI